MAVMKRWFLWAWIALLPGTGWSQSAAPEWASDTWRERNYPSELYYTGYVFDRVPTGGSLTEALKAIEDAARNSLAESIVIHIQSDSRLETQRASLQSGGQFSEQIASDYRQQISTSTNARAAGVEVRSHFDPATNLGYAFAFVNKEQLGRYYQHQIDLLLQRVESALDGVDDLVAVGKKMAASEKCAAALKDLAEADQFRTLCTAVAGQNAAALQTEKYTQLQRAAGQKMLDLDQSTRVYVTCSWKCREYPQYEEQAFVVEDLVKQSLSRQDCDIVEEPGSADFVLTMTASTSQRSDGSDVYKIISWYANVQGTLVNCHTNKTVSSFSILNDPRVYSAGKTDAVAVTKAFKQEALQEVILNAVMPRIKN